jgi:acetylornithine deacetylase
MNNLKKTDEQVLVKIEACRNDMVSFLQALVHQPSTLGNERSAQEIIFRKLNSLGITAELWEPRLSELCIHPAFAPVEWDYNGRPNVTGVLKGLGGGKSLALNGHIDVVSPEPLWSWSHDPWGAEIDGNRMYGRGTADMKGGIAMMVLALEALIKTGVKLMGDVYIETVIEEECGGNGALACRVRGHAANAEAAIITEDTGLTLGISELGVMWFRVRLRSSSGHVAQAHKSINVIESCYPLMQAFRHLEEEMNEQISHPDYLNQEHPINLNIGEIKGGHWPSSVPVECSFICRLSYEPGVPNLEMRKRVEACIAKASQENPLFQQYPPKVEYYGFQSNGDWINIDHPLVQSFGIAHKAVTKEDLVPLVFTGTTDMRSFNLYSKTPAVVYGPKGENIHSSDEYVEVDSIITGAKTLALFILNWCGIGEV